MFRKLSATLMSIAFLYCGILLIYRGLLTPLELRSVRSKINNLNIDVLSGNKGRITYAIAFDINAWNTRHGIFLGSNVSSKDEEVYQSLDSATLYTITVDPTITSSKGTTLDVRSILLNNKKIFEESTIPSIISGALLSLFSLVIFYFIFFRR